MAIRAFGELYGQQVVEGTLEGTGASLSVLSYGAAIRDWRVQAADGSVVPTVLGYDSFAPYLSQFRSFNIIAGRVANRTAFGRFDLDGKTVYLPANNGTHHIHGGNRGLGQRVWTMEEDRSANALRLTYDSPDGEEGYPGRAQFSVTFTLKGSRLDIAMRAEVDRATPINLAQHNYYNLDGGGDVRGHHLTLAASRYTPVDDLLIPTGEEASVEGTRYDFRGDGRTVEASDPNREGADINLVLDTDRDPSAPAAILRGARSGLELRMVTDQPGLQLYTAFKMGDLPLLGHGGVAYGNYSGICLEPQHFPDSLNKPHWPSILATPDTGYRQDLSIDIAPAG
ncbi:aldose epimerase family protein [Oceanomicrobium pacificus]|uniref:Aldose 1-epimerase n=1 Tax=Oceanomicrobium pacificus TaxID=2692916 RepID=A0A6B0TY03_9RHOB|nr:aldose epimerase family protein [Oceanomicrobium pacificus]MXU66172.1 galactose mutarotase [Oceanomicrobium pacificus]